MWTVATGKGTSYDSVLFYGKEFPLFLLDVLVFTLVDMAAFNFTLAAIVTFLVQWVSTRSSWLLAVVCMYIHIP